MKYFIIKRDDSGTQATPYFKEKSTWTSKWQDAEQFDDAIDAAYRQKRVDDNSQIRTYVCEVEVIEKEVVVQASAIVARENGFNPHKR